MSAPKKHDGSVDYKWRARVTRIVDGDTFDAEVDRGFRDFSRMRFRVLDLDTPETFRPRNDAELAHGKEATILAESLLDGVDVVIETHKAGSFGRWLAKVTLPDGSDFAETMIAAGMQKRQRYD